MCADLDGDWHFFEKFIVQTFEYSFEKALEVAGTTSIDENTILEFPQQRVIFLEENENIRSTISFKFRLPDGQLIPYTVPVMKYWEYSAEDLKTHKLYALLPLQVFKSRKRIQAIEKSKRTVAVKRRLITQEGIYPVKEDHSRGYSDSG